MDDDNVVTVVVPLTYKRTPRGFVLATFYDRYGAACSLQASSLATESAIWFGVDRDMHGQAVEHGRMHLTQDQAAMLWQHLQYFAEHGELPTADQLALPPGPVAPDSN